NSFAEENYLKAIFKLVNVDGNAASTNSIAEEMQTKAPSVTDMLKKLAQKKFIIHEKYQGVTLTSKGEKTALNIIRKHRLWEMFLVEKLNFKWNEVHDVAEQLEHIQSDKLIDELDKLLGFPKADPHGDLIPDAQGKLPVQKSKPLSKFTFKETCVMTGVSNHSNAFLTFLDEIKVGLGNTITIQEIVTFDHSLKILVNNKHEVFISHEVAKNILAILK
ncbi:MAG: metal-dependent transcriptional regulator, partial [Crocinitomicaceae bacterium]